MRAIFASVAVVFLFVLAGCAGTTHEAVKPADDVSPTGRTIRLKIHVEDLFNTTIYPSSTGSPGLRANLWGFCVEPVDPNDEVSVKAIEYWTPLDGDAPNLK